MDFFSFAGFGEFFLLIECNSIEPNQGLSLLSCQRELMAFEITMKFVELLVRITQRLVDLWLFSFLFIFFYNFDCTIDTVDQLFSERVSIDMMISKYFHYLSIRSCWLTEWLAGWLAVLSRWRWTHNPHIFENNFCKHCALTRAFDIMKRANAVYGVVELMTFYKLIAIVLWQECVNVAYGLSLSIHNLFAGKSMLDVIVTMCTSLFLDNKTDNRQNFFLCYTHIFCPQKEKKKMRCLRAYSFPRWIIAHANELIIIFNAHIW